MSVAVVFPWRGGCAHRDAARAWVTARYRRTHPTWEIVTGECHPDLPFNRSEAILDGARRTTAATIVIADADSWSDLTEAVRRVVMGCPWAVPHTFVHRLSAESTSRVLDEGAEPAGLPLSQENDRDSSPYRGFEAGTMLVIRREVLFDVPPDVRFVGWGREDQAWALALRALIGLPRHLTADLFHLWHPEPERINRVQSNEASESLWHRYKEADAQQLRELVEESKQLWGTRAA